MKRLVLFHYHFLPGGVTSVVRHILNAVKKAGEVQEVILCCATQMGISGLASDPGMPRFRFYDLPEMGYRQRETYDRSRFQHEKKAILKALTQMESPETLFWVHNHHLGKNPAFTAALWDYARKGESPLLLHLHDFPECGRWENYAFLKEYTEEWYPSGEQVWYGAINRRDYRILLESGVPAGRLFYLPDSSVPDGEMERSPASRKRARKAVQECCGKSGYNFDEKAPLFIYPVRTIRRKNVIEAFLIASMAKSNLIVTLPANSEPERPYEKVVAGLSGEGFFRGAWALSHSCPGSFQQVVQAADLVLSSSVMEGFGLFFLETKMRKANFMARSLDIMDDFKGLDRQGVYDILPVPEELAEREDLKDRYVKRIARLPLGKDRVQQLTERTLSALSKGPVDFAFLDVPRQAAILKERGAREEMAKAGKTLVEKALSLAGTFRDQGIDAECFSPGTYLKRITGLLETISGEAVREDRWKVEQRAVLDRFLRPEMIRLLLDYKGERT